MCHLNDTVVLRNTRLCQLNIDIKQGSATPPKTSTRRQRLRQSLTFELRQQTGWPLMPQQMPKIASGITEIMLGVITNREDNFQAAIRSCGFDTHYRRQQTLGKHRHINGVMNDITCRHL